MMNGINPGQVFAVYNGLTDEATVQGRTRPSAPAGCGTLR